jgi:hypothetical protein
MMTTIILEFLVSVDRLLLNETLIVIIFKRELK